MSRTRTDWVYLERDPKSSYLQLSIKGRRIRARTLYGLYMSEEDPRSIEQIAADYDLSVEAVREAIEYCQSNPPEILLDSKREELRAEAAGENQPGYKQHARPRPLTPDDYAHIDRELEAFRRKFEP